MALTFKCPNCQEDLVMRYLKVGEIAKCYHCGASVPVPADAKHVDGVDSKRASPPSASVTRRAGKDTGGTPASQRKNSGPQCYYCGRELTSMSERIKHYCSHCRKTLPEFMLDGIKHIYTRSLAAKAFSPGKPIEASEGFCDRNISIHDLVAYLSEFGLIGVLGERGVGKTTILKIVHHLLRGNPDLSRRYGSVRWPQRAVFINKAADMLELMEKAIQELLAVRPNFKRFGSLEEAEITGELSFFGVKTKAAIRKSSEWGAIRVAVEEGLGEKPRRCFELALRLINLAEMRTVILVDEADGFSKTECKALGELIKSCESYNVGFCFAGIMDNLDDICAGHRSLGRTYKPFQLKRFGLTEVQQLFNLANTRLVSYIQFTPALVERICDVSDGIPAIVQNFGYEILTRAVGDDWYAFAERARQRGPLLLGPESIDLAIDAIPEWLEHHWDHFAKLKARHEDFMPTLARIAQEPEYILYDDDCGTSSLDTDRTLATLEALCEEDVGPLLRRGSRTYPGEPPRVYYTFDDPVIGWLVRLVSRGLGGKNL